MANLKTYFYTYASDINMAVQIIGKANDIVELTRYFVLGDGDQDITLITEPDNNN